MLETSGFRTTPPSSFPFRKMDSPIIRILLSSFFLDSPIIRIPKRKPRLLATTGLRSSAAEKRDQEPIDTKNKEPTETKKERKERREGKKSKKSKKKKEKQEKKESLKTINR